MRKLPFQLSKFSTIKLRDNAEDKTMVIELGQYTGLEQAVIRDVTYQMEQ